MAVWAFEDRSPYRLRFVAPAQWVSSLLAGILLSGSLFGCSGSSNGAGERDIERTGGFEVKVHTNGHEVKNFEQELVHRAQITRQSLLELQRYSKREELAVPRKDERGGFQGLQVRANVPPAMLEVLGLKAGDIVTAFGPRKIDADMSFHEFLLSMDALPESTLTFERRGQPHKVIYLLDEVSSRTRAE